MANDLVNHAYVIMKPTQEPTKKMGLESFQVGEHIHIWRDAPQH